jgi:parallel beta-helix repeat protein
MPHSSLELKSTSPLSRTRSGWFGVPLLVVLTLVLTALVSRQSAEADTSGPTVLASDNFSRTVSSAWGSANLGGAWTVGSSPASTFAVSGGTASMALSPNGQGPAAWLNSVSSANTDLRLSVGTDKAATGSGTYVYVVGRNIAGAGSYVAKLRLKPGGMVALTLERRDGNTVESAMTPETAVVGLTVAPGERVEVRLQVAGTAPTTLRAKVWAAGQSEPSTWTLTQSDSTTVLQKPGSVGVTAYLSRSATNAPVEVSIAGLVAVSTLTPPAGEPTPSSTSPSPTPTASQPIVVPTNPLPTPTPSETIIAPPTSGRAAASAGSRPVGSTNYAIPAGAIFVSPSGNDSASGAQGAPLASVARAIALASSGGTIVLRNGTYHQTVNLPAGKALTVQSYPGEAVWFDGSRSVSNWLADGNGWVSSGWMSNFDDSPTYTRGAPDSTTPSWQWISPSYPMASHPDQVWIDGTALTQVDSRSSLSAGEFYVDVVNHRLYVGTDPLGHDVLSSDLTTAFTINSENTVLRGFGVHRYATSVSMMGTIRVYAANVTLENLVVSDNATEGISVDRANGTVNHVTTQNNGLLGIHANYADGLRITAVVSTNNNSQNFNTAPVSGGIKITRSRSILITNSVLSSNAGPGLWLDESCYNATVTGNDVASNAADGIRAEISDTMIVANNVLSNNRGAGVRLANTGDSAVWNNTFTNNNRDLNITQDPRDQYNLSNAGHDPRQSLPDPTVPWRSADIDVHNNVFAGSTGNALLAVEDWTHRFSAKDLGIITNNNVYLRASATSPKTAIIWSRGAGNPAVYSTITSFTSDTAQEVNSIAQDGAPVVSSISSAVTANVGAQLAENIAAVVGKAAGSKNLGAWF